MGELLQGESSGGVLSGVWTTDLCFDDGLLTTVADRTTQVPAPNSEGAIFNEFPSIPRIDADHFLLGTRGNHAPVESFILPDMSETKAGSNGLYYFDGQLKTAITVLGNFFDFSMFSVPGAPSLTKFDVFPGSPAFADGKYVVFKGNYVTPVPSQTAEPITISRTGVFFRDLSVAGLSPVLVANSATVIPGQSVTFDSTAPPSAAAGKMVFVGYDNEDAPTLGGIYSAPLTFAPALTTLVEVGATVPGADGLPLDGSTFTQFGEALSYDGRFLSFWGAWGTDTREIILECPEDGNQDLIDYCMANSPLPGGRTPVDVPVNQGIFIQDTTTGLTRMVARAGAGQQFHDFLFWNYSGRPPGTGGGDEEDVEEPPRWRSSAFVAVDGSRGVAFKGVKTPGPGVAEAGIYAVATATELSTVLTVMETGQSAAQIDPLAPADSSVVELGIEREAFRDGWFTLNASFTNAAEEGWAGIYATYIPDVALIGEFIAEEE